jgi:gamma-glutamyltranspeptidase/glutathione hydrolase
MGGGLVPGTYPPPRALRPDLSGERFAVVAGHSLVSMVAHDVLVAGGNAVDAGVAAGLASNVVQVDMANFGGIAPIVVRPAGGRDVWSIAGVGRWSTSASLDAILQRYAGTLPLDGAPAIVPGAPAAWLQALAQFGTMSLAEVAAPAITLATKGFLLDEATATSIRLSAKGFGRWPSSVAVYQQDGEPLAPGARLRQPALGETLQRLVAAEARASGSRKQRIRVAHREFYEGDIAQTLVSWVTDHGGYLTLDDLAAFEAEVTPAVSMRVKGWDFFTTPSWSQGPVALSILGLLSRLPH